jgi:hypothetical protein
LKSWRKTEIDISKNKPKLITTQMVQEADIIVVMGCSAQGFCPAPLPGKVTDWNIEDPKGKPIAKVGEIRDEIERRVKALFEEGPQSRLQLDRTDNAILTSDLKSTRKNLKVEIPARAPKRDSPADQSLLASCS